MTIFVTHCSFLRVNRTYGPVCQCTVLVSVLAIMLALLTIFLFAMTYVLSRFSIHQRNVNQLAARNLSEMGVAAGLHRLMSRRDATAQDSLVRFEEGLYFTSIVPWGPFFLLTSTGTCANQTATTRAIIGSDSRPEIESAITLTDLNFPLYVAGTARIHGNVITGPLGMAAGQIGGEAPEQHFHIGDVLKKPYVSFPRLDTAVIEQYFREVENRRLNTKKVLSSSLVLGKSDSIQFSAEGTLCIENDLLINGAEVSVYGTVMSVFVDGSSEIVANSKVGGFIELVSGGPVLMDDDAVVDNVLIYCEDAINITGYVTFSGIAISRKRIVVDDQATLVYPATLIVLADSTECDSCGIYLRSSRSMEGVCQIALTDTAVGQNDYLLYLDKASVFTGLLIAQTAADLRGTVNGSAVVRQFRYEQPPTTYINWIRDLKIDNSKLTFVPTTPLSATVEDSARFRILEQVTR